MSRRRASLLAALAVFVLAAGLRLAHVESLRQGFEGTHLFATGRVDAAFHLREARDILDEDVLLRDRVHWKGPGYSYFLAGLMLVFGRDPGGLRWVMALLGALNCAGLVLLARRYLKLPGAVLAGLLAALNGAVILFDGELYFPTLLISLSLGMLALLLKREGGRGSGFGAGACLGLAVLVHPSYLLVGAGVFLWLVRRGLTRALVFMAAVALIIAPVFLKNLLVHGEPVLVSSSGGINFYVGNQPGYDQTSGQGTQAWDRIVQTPFDVGIEGEAERDRLYYGLAMRQIAGHPWTAAKIFLSKLRIFLSPVEIANNFGIYELRDLSPVLRSTLGRAGPLWWPFGWWAALAWIGAVLLARRSVRGNGLLLIFVGAIALTCVLFFNTSRYRVPGVFVGSIWAAAMLEAGWGLLREKRWPRLAASAVGVALIGLVTAGLVVPQVAVPPPTEFTEAQVLEGMGRHREAAALYDGIGTAHPDHPGMLLAAAAFHGRRGNQERSREFLRRVIELPDLGPDDRSNTYEALGQSYLVQGRLNEAEVALRSALEVGVDDAIWRGEPFFAMGLGPVTECRLRLGLAEIAMRRGDRFVAAALVDGVVQECGDHGRIGENLVSFGRQPQ